MKLIVRGMKAHLIDGSMVEIVDIVTDARSGSEQYLVLATHGLFGPDVAVPISAIWYVDKDVHLALGAKEAEALPRIDPSEFRHQEGYAGYITWLH